MYSLLALDAFPISVLGVSNNKTSHQLLWLMISYNYYILLCDIIDKRLYRLSMVTPSAEPAVWRMRSAPVKVARASVVKTTTL